jgi:hypothetical protein
MWVACCKFVAVIRIFKKFLRPIQAAYKNHQVYDHLQGNIFFIYYLTACLIANFKQPIWNK